MDEHAHLASGVGHWMHGNFELFRANPPLTRMIASLPLVLSGETGEWLGYSDVPGTRLEFDAGRALVNTHGHDVFRLFTLGRWACIPISLLGGCVCWLWARDLYGNAAGLLALALWCFSPNILANASFIMPDLGAGALGLCAGYAFWKWLRAPTGERTLLAGLALGAALLTKLTWIILFGLWPLLWLGWRLAGRQHTSPTHKRANTWWRGLNPSLTRRADVVHREGLDGASSESAPATVGRLILMLLLGLLVLNIAYGFQGSFRRLGEFQFVSESLAGPREEWFEPRSGNRFAGTPMGAVPVPLPADYLLGIDIVKQAFEMNRQSYLGGEWSNGGWWYYYLYALAVKVPLGTWLLVLLALGTTLSSSRYSAGARDTPVLLAPALVILLLVSANSGINRHFRYALPILPFVFIWVSQVARSFELGHRCVAAVATVGLGWSIGSSLWVYPHSASYFNELAGGPKNGHAHLISTNIDWGQDLLYLKDWLDEHPEARPLGLAYYGPIDARIAGIEYTLPPYGPPERREHHVTGVDRYGPHPGWYAVSVHILRGSQSTVYDGTARRLQLPFEAYTYFLNLEPVAMAGYSIYVYHVTPEEADLVRGELGLPPLTRQPGEGEM